MRAGRGPAETQCGFVRGQGPRFGTGTLEPAGMMSERLPPGATARVLMALARVAHAKGVLMPTQTTIAATIGRTTCSVYAAWKKLQDEGKIRAKVEFVGQYRRVRIEEVTE